MRWNLRMAAARRDIWKSSQLQRMLAEAGLVISAGKMSNLWSGQPVTIRLDDLDVICAVLGCGVEELLAPEPDKAAARRPAPDTAPGTQPSQAHQATAVGAGGTVRRRPGRHAPPV